MTMGALCPGSRVLVFYRRAKSFGFLAHQKAQVCCSGTVVTLTPFAPIPSIDMHCLIVLGRVGRHFLKIHWTRAYTS